MERSTLAVEKITIKAVYGHPNECGSTDYVLDFSRSEKIISKYSEISGKKVLKNKDVLPLKKGPQSFIKYYKRVMAVLADENQYFAPVMDFGLDIKIKLEHSKIEASGSIAIKDDYIFEICREILDKEFKE